MKTYLCVITCLAVASSTPCARKDRKIPLSQKENHVKLVRGVKSGDAQVRDVALEAISRMKMEEKLALLPLIFDAMSDDDGESRGRLAAVFKQIGPKAVPELVGHLKDKDERVRQVSASGLGTLLFRYPEAQLAVPSLCEALKDKNGGVRYEAAQALVWSKDDSCIPHLINAFAHEGDSQVKVFILRALSVFGARAKAAIPLLIDDLVKAGARDEFIELSGTIGSALADIGTESVDPILAIVKSQKYGENVRCAACSTLLLLGPKLTETPGAVKTLSQILENSSPNLKLRIIEILGAIGPGAREAIPALRLVTQSKQLVPRIRAAGALFQIDSSNKVSLPVLMEVVDHGYCYALRAAELFQLDPQNVLTLLATFASFEERSSWLREEAINELAKIGPKATPAIPALIISFKDRDESVRSAAVSALSSIGNAAVAPLQQALKDEDRHVRWAAQEALESIIGSGHSAGPR